MSERLNNYIARHRDPIESALCTYLPLSHQPHASSLNAALEYSLFPGGKRWRPIFTLLGAELVGAKPESVLPSACAVEYLHTSSIILDDLPSMDDADRRRGRATLHIAFGESVAILAALALLNQSYGLLAMTVRANGCFEAGIGLIEEAVRLIGSDGMIGGQVVDLALEGSGQREDSLASKNLKTTALMRLTMTAGAIAFGAGADDVRILASFGEDLGMAYQICDDLLDRLVPAEELGKPSGQDSRHSRSTHVSSIGVKSAHQLASDLVGNGIQKLTARFGSGEVIGLLTDASSLVLRGMGRLASTSD